MMFPFGKPQCIDQSSLISPENLHMDQDISILTRGLWLEGPFEKKNIIDRVSDVNTNQQTYQWHEDNKPSDDLNSKAWRKTWFTGSLNDCKLREELQLEPAAWVGGTTIPETGGVYFTTEKSIKILLQLFNVQDSFTHFLTKHLFYLFLHVLHHDVCLSTPADTFQLTPFRLTCVIFTTSHIYVHVSVSLLLCPCPCITHVWCPP